MWVLRESTSRLNLEVDLHAITDRSVDLGMKNSKELLDFADAVVGANEKELEEAREALHVAMGPAGVVRASAIAGCFSMNDAVANAIGIRLDGPILLGTVDFRQDCGINEYPSARNSI